MGVITKKTVENKSGGSRLTARIKRKGKKRFGKKIVLKEGGKKDDRY